MNELISVAVLAGGQSSRMGTDKSFVQLNGKPLIQHVLETVRLLSVPITLITNDPEPYRAFGLPIFSDIFPEKGSLGGLYTAISYSSTPYTLCIACDMPFLNQALLLYLMRQCEGFDAVVPRIGGRPQPIHAVYGGGCLSPIKRQIEEGQLRVRELYPRIKCRFVDDDELKQIDPELKSFTNINTPEEMEQAKE